MSEALLHHELEEAYGDWRGIVEAARAHLSCPDLTSEETVEKAMLAVYRVECGAGKTHVPDVDVYHYQRTVWAVLRAIGKPPQ